MRLKYPHPRRSTPDLTIPKGWRRLRAGTKLKEGDKFEWVTGWCSVEVSTWGNYAANPYVYIRRGRK